MRASDAINSQIKLLAKNMVFFHTGVFLERKSHERSCIRKWI